MRRSIKRDRFAALHSSRVRSRKSGICRLKCSAGRVSRTKLSSTRGSHGDGPSIAPGTTSVRNVAIVCGQVVEARVRRDHVGQQRFADRVFVDREFARLDGREQDVLLARALVFERALDRGQHRGLFEHQQRVGSR
jgi:hypothetical protein